MDSYHFKLIFQENLVIFYIIHQFLVIIYKCITEVYVLFSCANLETEESVHNVFLMGKWYTLMFPKWGGNTCFLVRLSDYYNSSFSSFSCLLHNFGTKRVKVQWTNRRNKFLLFHTHIVFSGQTIKCPKSCIDFNFDEYLCALQTLRRTNIFIHIWYYHRMILDLCIYSSE